jgi:predicted nucleic acid-binding protein
MTRYLDTGVILKLYTLEPLSPAIRQMVVTAGEPICFTPLHHAECVSALKLKVFRGECAEPEAASTILDLESDLASGVLRRTVVDWVDVWELCRQLSVAHAAVIGSRTLDTLHVASAIQLGLREFVSTDARQRQLAERAGLRVGTIPGS